MMEAKAFCIICGSPLSIIFGRGSAKTHGIIVCPSCNKRVKDDAWHYEKLKKENIYDETRNEADGAKDAKAGTP